MSMGSPPGSGVSWLGISRAGSHQKMQFCCSHPRHGFRFPLQHARRRTVKYQGKTVRRTKAREGLERRDMGCTRIHAGLENPGMMKREGMDAVVWEFRNAVNKRGSRGGGGAGRSSKWLECKRLALDNMGSCTPNRISQILHCCSRAGYFDGELLEVLVRRALSGDEKYMLGFQAIGLSMTIQSLGKLARIGRRRGKWDSRPIQRLSKQFALRLIGAFADKGLFGRNYFNGRTLSSTVHGLGLMFARETNEDVVRQVSQYTEQVVQILLKKAKDGQVNLLDMCNVLHGCANLDFRNRVLVKDVCFLVRNSSSIGRNTNGQALSTLSWSLAKLRVDDDGTCKWLAMEVRKDWKHLDINMQHLAIITHSFATLGYYDEAFLDKVSEEILKEERMQFCKNQDLGMFVFGCGKFGYGREDAFKAIGQELCQEHRIRRTSHQVLANVMYGFGRAHFFDENVFAGLLNAIQAKLQEFTMNELSNFIVPGLREIQDQILDSSLRGRFMGLLECICCECKGKGSKLVASAVASMCHNLTEIRYVDNQLMDALLERYIEIGKTDENEVVEEHLSTILSSCAVLNHHNSSFLQFVREYLERKQESMSIEGLCEILWACTILGTSEDDLIPDICHWIEEMSSSNVVMKEAAWMRLAQALAYLNLAKSHDIQFGDGTKALMERAMDACHSQNVAENPASDIEVSKQLTDLGVPYSSNAPVASGLLHADILISDWDPAIVINCRGPSSYSLNTTDGQFTALGQTLMEDMLLEAHGYKVVCIPYFTTEAETKELIESAVGGESSRDALLAEADTS